MQGQGMIIYANGDVYKGYHTIWVEFSRYKNLKGFVPAGSLGAQKTMFV